MRRPEAAAPLAARLHAIIREAGPMPLARYMDICLNDPDHGYYATRRPIGAGGDFTTAPEVSQMFGELIGVWCMSAWAAMGRPVRFALVEIGPGGGTLMADMLRVARSQPAFETALEPHLVETSPTLRRVQHETLARAATWHESVDTLPNLPLVLVANELLDALPFEQCVRRASRWRQRLVGERDGHLLLVDGGVVALDRDGGDGEIVETAPLREAMVAQTADLIARRRGAALWIDYGSLTGGTGDTFQAVANHRPVDPFARPGEADLTSHVDFAALAHAARRHGCEVQADAQGPFLLRMGLMERAGTLARAGGPEQRRQITHDVERLAGPSAMGELFKVLAVRSRHLPPLRGFEEET